MPDRNLLILGVALLTWGGVFVYLLRLDAMARRLEKQLLVCERESSALDASAGEGTSRLSTTGGN